MESSVWALCAVVISFIIALLLYTNEGNAVYFYMQLLCGYRMLSHTGNNVAMDSYGPISDNANGIGEMAWHDMDDENTKKARQIMADLDAVGKYDQSITKGVAIASAVIAAVSLFDRTLRMLHGFSYNSAKSPWKPSAYRRRKSLSACCLVERYRGCLRPYPSEP